MLPTYLIRKPNTSDAYLRYGTRSEAYSDASHVAACMECSAHLGAGPSSAVRVTFEHRGVLLDGAEVVYLTVTCLPCASVVGSRLAPHQYVPSCGPYATRCGLPHSDEDRRSAHRSWGDGSPEYLARLGLI